MSGRAKTITASKDILDALISRKFVGLGCPARGESASVHVLKLRGVAGFVGAEGGDAAGSGGVRVRGFEGFVGNEAGDTAEDGRGFEWWGYEVSLAVDLDHKDADLEGGVDLRLLHQVPSDDAVLNVVHGAVFFEFGGGVGGTRAGVGCFTDGEAAHGTAFAVMAGLFGEEGGGPAHSVVWGCWGSAIAEDGLAFFDVLAEIDADDAECDLLFPDIGGTVAGVEFLEDFKLDPTLGEVGKLINGYAEGDDFAVDVLDPVVGNGTFRCPAAVLLVDAVWEMPFDERRARDKWDVV